MNVEILPGKSAGSALVRDYLAGEPAAMRFFPSSPTDPAAFRARLREVSDRFGPIERARAAAALRPTSPAAADRLDQFVEQGGAVVTTGQQAGLFSGPLYTIYKALTAARLAQALERELGSIVLPIFWVASEDHDWEEVNHVDLLDHSHRLTHFGLSGTNDPPISMARHPLGSDINRILDEMADVTAGHEFSDRYIKLIRRAYRPGATVAAAFGDLLQELLGQFDMLMVDAADPAMKEASRALLGDSLARSAEEERVVGERTRELESAGYHGQVAVLPNATNVFYEGETGRERVYRRRDEFTLLESGKDLTQSDLDRILANDPGRFSPNVFLRPLVESTVFPVLTYVAGPGEASYFAQIGPLFELHGMRSPVVTPRASFVIVEPAMREVLDELGLTVDEIGRPRHEVLTRLARPLVPADVNEALARVREDISGDYRGLIEAALPLDPNLAGALASVRNEALAGAGRAERKILAHVKRRNGDIAERLDLLRENLWPGGEPQERVLNVMSYLPKYGPELLTAVANKIEFPWLK